MFKELWNLPGVLRQASEMTERMKEAGERLRVQRFTASSGGGLVEVEANGAGEVLKIRLDPRLLAKQDAEMVADLLIAATNQALEKGRQAQMQMMQEMGQGFDMPGLQSMLERVIGRPT